MVANRRNAGFREGPRTLVCIKMVLPLLCEEGKRRRLEVARGGRGRSI